MYVISQREGIYMMRRLVAIALLLALLPASLMAYQLSPLNATYEPTGAGSAKVYTIVNDSDSPIAIEVRAVKRSIDIDGNEYTEDASPYFTIQPAKMIIRPQSTQLVRVQYRGPQALTQEQSFRIIAEQIAMPQSAQEQTSGQMISFLFVYSTSAYVKPSRIVESISSEAYINDEGMLEVMIHNTGSVHQLLNNIAITVSSAEGDSYQFTEADLESITGSNLLTDSSRRVVIDVPEILAGDTGLSAEVTYSYSYSE